MECRTPPYRVEIIDDALVLIDRTGTGTTMAELTTRAATRRQLQNWATDYTFDADAAQRAVDAFFDAE